MQLLPFALASAQNISRPDGKQLQCLFHLPLDMGRQNKGPPSDLIFPTMNTVERCLELNEVVEKPQWMGEVKFCLSQLRFDLGEFAGMPHDPHRWLTHVSITAGLCLPESCHSEDLVRLLKWFCAVPDCLLLGKAELISMCHKMQPLLCGPSKPHEFDHEIFLQCLDEPVMSPFLMVSDKTPYHLDKETKDQIESAKIMKDLLDVSSEELLSEDSSHPLLGQVVPWDFTMSRSELDVLLNCGYRSVENFELWRASGNIGSMGDWDTCPGIDVPQPTNGSPGHYCTLRYLGLLVAGRCIPHECSEDSLIKLLQLVCSYTSQTKSERIRNCLDFVNVIPLDLCLSTQLFGCGNIQAFANTTRTSGLSELIANTLARADLPQRRIEIAPDVRQAVEAAEEVIHSVIGPALGKKIGTYPLAEIMSVRRYIENVVNTTFMQMPEKYRRDQFKVVNDIPKHSAVRHLGSMQDGLSVRTFCEFCQKKTSRNVLMITGSLMLISSAFFLLPLLGWSVSATKRFDVQPPIDGRFIIDEPVTTLWVKWMMCFSLGTNIKSFIRNAIKVQNGDFPHLSGMRVLSMFWICLGHTLCFMVVNGPIINLPFTFELLKRLDFQLIVSGPFSVDTFFFISGFLLAVYGYPQLEKKLKSDNLSLSRQVQLFGHIILHRYLRLSAVYFFILALYIWGLRFIRTGPMWPIMVDFIDNGMAGGCRDYWWTNILYINNIYPDNSTTCFSWTWFLACDFQFFILSNLLFFVKIRSKRAFKYTFSTLFVTSVLSGIYTILKWHLKVAILAFSAEIPSAAKELTEPFEGFQHFYFKPWCRLPSHLVGILFGFFFTAGVFQSFCQHKEEEALCRSPLQDNTNTNLNIEESISQPLTVIPTPLPQTTVASDKRWIILCHFTSLAIMTFLIYIVWGPNKVGKETWPRWLDIAYLAFSKIIWCVCIGWFTVSLAKINKDHMSLDCVTRSIHTILTAPVFAYTAPLVYSVYLIHPVIQQAYWGAQTTALRVDRLFIYANALGFIAMSFLLAYPLVIFVEVPLSKFFRTLKL